MNLFVGAAIANETNQKDGNNGDDNDYDTLAPLTQEGQSATDGHAGYPSSNEENNGK